MKKVMLLSLFMLIHLMFFGQNQLSLNIQATSEYEKVDKELNQVYRELTKIYRDDTIFINSMKEAQRQWIKFRDAQVKMKYPLYKNTVKSVLPMCRAYYLKELTTNRIKELKQWIDGVEEGDACSGSIRYKE